jgi:hypothetical protein
MIGPHNNLDVGIGWTIPLVRDLYVSCHCQLRFPWIQFSERRDGLTISPS